MNLFAPGLCISDISAQLKFNPAVKFLNPNIGPKCELYSYIHRFKCFYFFKKIILNKLYLFGINCSINYHRSRPSGCVLSSTIFYSILCIFTVILPSGWYK